MTNNGGNMTPAAKTKVFQNGSLKTLILIIGFLVTITTIVFATGTLKGEILTKVNANALNIETHYQEGCKPSIDVRSTISAIKADAQARQKQLDRIETKLDRLIEDK